MISTFKNINASTPITNSGQKNEYKKLQNIEFLIRLFWFQTDVDNKIGINISNTMIDENIKNNGDNGEKLKSKILIRA